MGLLGGLEAQWQLGICELHEKVFVNELSPLVQVQMVHLRTDGTSWIDLVGQALCANRCVSRSEIHHQTRHLKNRPFDTLVYDDAPQTGHGLPLNASSRLLG